MNRKKLLLSCLSLISITKSVAEVSTERSCHIFGKGIKNKNYSTKTPYQYIVDDLNVEDTGDYQGSGSHSINKCENLQYWSLIRHGTRYPSAKGIEILNEYSKLIRDRIVESKTSQLCDLDLKLFKEWSLDVDPDLAKDLHVEGEEELIYMGERLFSRYPDLFKDYHEDQFLFRSTATQRSQLSGESLALGLFSRPVAKHVVFDKPVTPHDPLIRFYKLCDTWIQNVKKNETSRHEHYKFATSQYVESVRQNLTHLLGFEELISLEDLEAMYLTCNFDQAWLPKKPSPWCSLFTSESLEVMEYLEDLEYYWIDGPGHEISWKPACVLMRDVYQNFNNVTKGAKEERGIFYFTHSGTVLKFLAYLGTHNDTEHLRNDNFEQMKNRKWRTSKISPFAANINFLLQKCDMGYVVCLYVNEKLETLPGCGEGPGCCDWQTFVSLYKDKIETCDFNSLCFNGDKSGDNLEVADDRF